MQTCFFKMLISIKYIYIYMLLWVTLSLAVWELLPAQDFCMNGYIHWGSSALHPCWKLFSLEWLQHFMHASKFISIKDLFCLGDWINSGRAKQFTREPEKWRRPTVLRVFRALRGMETCRYVDTTEHSVSRGWPEWEQSKWFQMFFRFLQQLIKQTLRFRGKYTNTLRRGKYVET